MSRVSAEPAFAAASSGALRPRLRLGLAVLLGSFALVILAWSVLSPVTTVLPLILLALFAAELLLAIHIDEHQTISISSPFLFVAFLTQGAAVAGVAQVAAWSCAGLVWQWRRRLQPQRRAIVVPALTQLTCHLAAGCAVWFVTGTPLSAPPTAWMRSLVLYVAAYLLCAVFLTLLSSVSGTSQREPAPPIGVDSELLALVSFVAGAPAAILILSLQSELGFAVDLLLAFLVLAGISYVATLRLRLAETELEYTVLNDISRNLAGSTELQKLYPVIYSRVRQVMPADVFFIGMLNEKQTEIDLVFVVEGSELQLPRGVPLVGTIADQVVRQSQPVYLLHGVSDAPLLRFGKSERSAAAALFVPLCLGDTPIGVMSAQSYTADVYTPQHLALLESIGRIAAVAINNARLFAREKEVLRSREEFVSLVAHELKNPLAALLGHIQILERRARGADDKLRRAVGIVGEQGERMNRMVEDLLDLSRADSGRLPLHLQRVDLSSLVRDVVEQHRVITERHTLVVEIVDALPIVEGDVLRLSQVLQNLLGNAIKYSPGGGTIRVRLERWPGDAPGWPAILRKATASARYWAVIRVADEGIGIQPDQIDRIFDRFYRVNSAMQLEVAGAGLGLSVCEGLVRAQGGVIWVESELNVGSTFSFALPVPEQREEPRTKNQEPRT